MSLVTVPKMGLTREIRNFEHQYRHNLRPIYGTWRDTPRLWILGRTREASPGRFVTGVEHIWGFDHRGRKRTVSTVLSSWVNIIKTSGCF